jgi:hypothetical protein
LREVLWQVTTRFVQQSSTSTTQGTVPVRKAA